MEFEEIMQKLKFHSNPEAVKGMANFGINPDHNFGVSVNTIRKIAKKIDRDHTLAQQLWSTGIRDAMMLACLIDEPKKVTEKQMESWILDFSSWDVCDHCCGNLFDRTEFAYQKAIEWSKRDEKFVKRAGFALMAWLGVHDKKAEDIEFERFLEAIEEQALDDRNYVRKAINWALRQIGKRNQNLNKKAIETATRIQKIESKSAKWIASDALRELTSEKVNERLNKKKI